MNESENLKKAWKILDDAAYAVYKEEKGLSPAFSFIYHAQNYILDQRKTLFRETFDPPPEKESSSGGVTRFLNRLLGY